MYNEKSEVEKVNFGDLPVDWDDDVEFADPNMELDVQQESTQRMKNKINPNKSSKR